MRERESLEEGRERKRKEERRRKGKVVKREGTKEVWE
jgi:hypothetical protein